MHYTIFLRGQRNGHCKISKNLSSNLSNGLGGRYLPFLSIDYQILHVEWNGCRKLCNFEAFDVEQLVLLKLNLCSQTH